MNFIQNIVNQKNIAILISGEVRTFVLKEQRLFFKKLIEHLKQNYRIVDVFIVLKIPDEHNTNNLLIQSNTGLKNFNKIIQILNPKYLYCFYDFIFKSEFTNYNVQLKLIDMCIMAALNYEKYKNIKYDTFFRIRPDSCFLLKELDIKDTNNIYTSIKSDAPANDQVFIINRFLLKDWWFSHVKEIIDKILDVPPEYRMFNPYKKYVISNFQNWLIRGYNDVNNWDKKSNQKPLLSTEYKFKYINNYNNLLITIPHTIFIEEIKKIPNLILNTYIKY